MSVTTTPPNSQEVVDLSAGDDTATLRAHSPGRLELVGPTIAGFDFAIPTDSLTIGGGSGADRLTIEGFVDLGGASLVVDFEQIDMPPGSVLQTTGDVTLSAMAVSTGSVAPGTVPTYVAEDLAGLASIGSAAASEINLDGATLSANAVNLSATVSASAAATTDTFAHLAVDATADIAVNDSNLSSQGELSISTVLAVDGTADSSALAGDLNGADGAVASVDVTTLSSARVTGSSVITAGGALSIQSTSGVDAVGSGDGATGSVGGGVAMVRVAEVTRAFIDTADVEWTADSVSVRSISDNAISSVSTSSPDGADLADAGANYPTPGERTEGQSAALISGALSFTKHDSTVEAYIQGDVAIASNGAHVVEALSSYDNSAVADGSTADAGGTGDANAIAVNLVDAQTRAWLDESADLGAPGGLTVRAEQLAASPDTFGATATPGQTATPPPVPESLELSVVDNQRIASIVPGPSLLVGGLTMIDDANSTRLTLDGTVVNDNGGTAVVSDWSFTAAGSSGVPGGFDLAQSGPTGYELIALTCDDAPGEVVSVSLAVGDATTCTFVLDDD